jgi:hypothetical protein
MQSPLSLAAQPPSFERPSSGRQGLAKGKLAALASQSGNSVTNPFNMDESGRNIE